MKKPKRISIMEGQLIAGDSDDDDDYDDEQQEPKISSSSSFKSDTSMNTSTNQDGDDGQVQMHEMKYDTSEEESSRSKQPNEIIETDVQAEIPDEEQYDVNKESLHNPRNQFDANDNEKAEGMIFDQANMEDFDL